MGPLTCQHIESLPAEERELTLKIYKIVDQINAANHELAFLNVGLTV